MARVKIDLPEKFDFSTDIPIRMSDINAGNHLGATSILPLTSEAKLIFLRHLGFTSLDIYGCAYIMADAAMIFKSQGFYGQTLKIEIAVRDFTKKACDFIYRITNKETGIEIARVKTCTVFFDYKTQKPVDVPAKFRSIFEPRE
ncbi:MAG: thioesterase family protein [Dehalococcoidia bacterium]